ncbi:response regulator [Streptomyces sp. NPDC001635]
MSDSVIRVMIVDDEILMREGLRRILDSFRGVRVVAVCTGEEAVLEAQRRRPDLVLLDIGMPCRDGLSVLAGLRKLKRPPVVAMLTAFGVEGYLFAALRGGAAGFLLKDIPPEQLNYALKELAKGNSVIAPQMTRPVIDEYLTRTSASSPSPSDDDSRWAKNRNRSVEAGIAEEFTVREREVLELLARGLSNSEIGRELSIGAATVKGHVSLLLGKLGVTNRVQAAVRAHQRGLVTAAAVGE